MVERRFPAPGLFGFCLFALSWFPCSRLQAQPRVKQQIDSLFSALKNANDTTQSLIYLELSMRNVLDSTEYALHLTNQARAVAAQIQYRNGMALYYDLIANYQMILFNNIERARLYLDSAKLFVTTPYAGRPVYASWATYYYLTGQHDKGYEAALTALKMNGDKVDRVTTDIYKYLDLCANAIGRSRLAKKYLFKLYETAIQLNQKGIIGGTLSNLAMTYYAEEKIDSALLLFRKLYQFELLHGNPNDNVILLSGLGAIYQDKEKFDSAFYFLKRALAAADRVKIPEGYGSIYNTLARHYLKSKPDSSLYYSRKAKQFTNGSNYEFGFTLLLLARSHKALNNIDSAYYYLDQYRLVSDSTLNRTRIQQLGELEAIYQSELKDARINELHSQQKASQLTTFLLTVSILALIVLGLCLYIFFRMKMKARRKEIMAKSAQLQEYVQKLLEKTSLLEELKAQVEKLEVQAGMSGPIADLTAMLNASLLTEDDWLEFKSIFERVHRGFFAKLRDLYPDLTTSEIRLSALIKLNLQTREIANMLAISVDSVSKARKRLRKSLNLSPEQDLRQFIEAITESGQMAA